MTESQEDYLEMVSFLSDEGCVRVTDIASRLGYSKPAVTAALKLLEERGLVCHRPYCPVTLTPDGKRFACCVRERHDLLKRFLMERLFVSEDTASKDACKMEHILSEETLESIRAEMEA
jgi:DtxR family Mn-dependent transcriptional regulator